MENMPL